VLVSIRPTGNDICRPIIAAATGLLIDDLRLE
jgi:hypothetical protein